MGDYVVKFNQRGLKLPHPLRTAIKDVHRAKRNIELQRRAKVLIRKLNNPKDQDWAQSLVDQASLPQIERLVQGAL